MLLRVRMQGQSKGCQGIRQEGGSEVHQRAKGCSAASCDARVQGVLSPPEAGMQGQLKQSSQ